MSAIPLNPLSAHRDKLIYPLLTLFLIVTPLAFSGDEKVRQAIEKGVLTAEFLKTLTPDDVPEKWKAQRTLKETDSRFTQVYTRDGVRVLELMWAKDWKGDKEKMFIATVYHGEKRLIKIVHLHDSTSVMPSEAPKGYDLYTEIKDEGTVTVNVINEASSFFESIVVKGRDTHPLDDLDYTKTVLSLETFVKPLVSALRNAIDKKQKVKRPNE